VASNDNKLIVLRFFEELWNQQNLAVADEIFAENLLFRGTLGSSDVGISAFKRYFEFARTAFSNLRAEIHELIVAGDAVVARVTWSARHSGELFGIPATGREWSYEAAAIFHLRDAKIVNAWTVGDTQELWRVLGVAPPPRTPHDSTD
jgi:steroid delta-isomerase-like uncharacterized protein